MNSFLLLSARPSGPGPLIAPPDVAGGIGCRDMLTNGVVNDDVELRVENTRSVDGVRLANGRRGGRIAPLLLLAHK